MVTRTNKSKTITKHILYDFRCKFDYRKCNLNQKRNKKLCQCECKHPIKHYVWKKNLLAILAHVLWNVCYETFLEKCLNEYHMTSTSKECIIFQYCYFLDKGFKFRPAACNVCHDVMMMSIDLNRIAIW